MLRCTLETLSCEPQQQVNETEDLTRGRSWCEDPSRLNQRRVECLFLPAAYWVQPLQPARYSPVSFSKTLAFSPIEKPRNRRQGREKRQPTTT